LEGFGEVLRAILKVENLSPDPTLLPCPDHKKSKKAKNAQKAAWEAFSGGKRLPDSLSHPEEAVL